MSRTGSFVGKAEKSVEELVSAIERGDLRLPEMQRQYVWRSTRVRDLLDSLYRGYPSGAILLWETTEDVPTRDFAFATAEGATRSVQLLLDGQQRLTSLAAILRGHGVTVRGRQRPIELLFNLEHPEGLPRVTEINEDSDDDEPEDDEIDSTTDELRRRFAQMTFVVSSRALAADPLWVKVTDVFTTTSDADFLRRAGIRDFDDPRYNRYTERLARLRAIRKYTYRMDVLESGLSYEEVTEIFVRVNSLGAKLRSSDLALAQITARWRNSLDTFQQYQRQCAEHGFSLELGTHLKMLIVLATGKSHFRTVGNIPLEVLQAAWDDARRAMDFAINFVKSNCGINSPALLASPFLLIALGYYGHQARYQLNPEEAELLRRWALIANAKGRYSRGSTESYLDQDLKGIQERDGAQGLMDRLRLQVGRLEVTVEDLSGRNQKSAYFKTMFLAFRQSGACDWASSLTIDLNRAGAQHKLQFHHIFPKALIRNIHAQSDVDDIANLAFINASTNQGISASDPQVYLRGLIDNGRTNDLAVQAIPLQPELYVVDRYHDFLTARRELIAQRLNEFLGTSAGE